MPKVSGEVVRVWLGHVVHYCEIMRLALSVLRSSYRFVHLSLGTTPSKLRSTGDANILVALSSLLKSILLPRVSTIFTVSTRVSPVIV